MMARPARVRMRARKPCLRARRRVLGWKVRFTEAPGIDQLASNGGGTTDDDERRHPASIHWPTGSYRRRQVPTRQGYGPSSTSGNRSTGRDPAV